MQQKKICRTLKKTLKEQKIRYGTVARWLGLSESSVKRLFSKESLTLDQIEVICKSLDFDFVKLVLLANPEKQLPEKLELEQEAELAANPEMFRFFYLLFRKWKVSEIVKAWKLSQLEVTRMLRRLEKLGLIDVFPENRVRLRVGARLKWLPKGPLEQLYRKDVTESFFADFSDDAPEQFLIFIPCELSRGGARRIQKRLAQVATEIQELSEIEAQVHKEASHGHGVLLALRPWVLPLFVPQ